MRNIRLLLLSLVVTGAAAAALAGKPGPAPQSKPPSAEQAPAAQAEESDPIRLAWLGLPSIRGHRCADQDLVFDYEKDGGMRNFFCRTLSVLSWKTFLKLAPAPFRKGPHKKGKLNLHSRDFGYYDPAFVRWASDHLVPGAEDPAFRAATQGIYDDQVRTLARLYHRVFRALAAHPAWVEKERAHYLGAADRGLTGAFDEALDLYHDVLGTADEDWGGADPNHVRGATGFWLRRYHDGTAELWAAGLDKLLRTYDASWLASEAKKTPRPLPQRKKAFTPEYR